MKGQGMGEESQQTNVRNGVVQHLEDAFDTNDWSRKDFHIKQALQLLDFASVDE